MHAERIARESCAAVFAAIPKDAGAAYAALAEREFAAGAARGITAAANGEDILTLELFAQGGWRALGIVAGYDAWFTEEDAKRSAA